MNVTPTLRSAFHLFLEEECENSRTVMKDKLGFNHLTDIGRLLNTKKRVNGKVWNRIEPKLRPFIKRCQRIKTEVLEENTDMIDAMTNKILDMDETERQKTFNWVMFGREAMMADEMSKWMLQTFDNEGRPCMTINKINATKNINSFWRTHFKKSESVINKKLEDKSIDEILSFFQEIDESAQLVDKEIDVLIYITFDV